MGSSYTWCNSTRVTHFLNYLETTHTSKIENNNNNNNNNKEMLCPQYFHNILQQILWQVVTC